MSDVTAPLGVPRWLNKASNFSWRLLIVGIAIYVLGRAIDRLHVIVLPVAAALFLSTILVPPARWLRKHHIPPALATWMVMLAGLAIVTGAVLGVYPSIRNEFSQLGSQLNAGLQDVRDWLQGPPLRLSPDQLNSYVNTISSSVSDYRNTLVHGAVTGITTIIEVVAALFLTFVLTFFFVKDGEAIADWFVDLFHEDKKDELRTLGRRSWATLSGYVRGTAINGVVNASVMAAGLLIIGVPLVVPIALVTFVGGFLPLAGAILSGGVATLAALVARGPVAALLVVVLTVIIHQLEGYIVGPLVLGHAVKLHPIAILLALTVGTIIAGVLGAFVAVPLTAVIAEVVAYYRGHGSPKDAAEVT